MSERKFDVDGIKELRAAVVRQACFDYLSTLRKPDRKIPYETKNGVKRYDTKDSITKWFHSKEFKKFCSVDGESILQQLRENHANGLGLRSDP